MIETDILKRVRSQDRVAFDEYYRLYWASLVNYAILITQDHPASEDVVQGVFLKVWQNRKYTIPAEEMRAYLFRAVYNSSVNVLRSRRRQTGSLSSSDKIDILLAEKLCPDNNPIINKLYTEDLRKKIDSAMESLTDRCREVFTLSYIEGLKEKEIAARLGLSLSTVENHMYRALKLLRKSLCDAEILIWAAILIQNF